MNRVGFAAVVASAVFFAAPAAAVTIVNAGSPGTTGATAMWMQASDLTVVATNGSATIPAPGKFTAWSGVADRNGASLGGWTATYDLGLYRLLNGVGQDFNVYEDWGGGHSIEFGDLSIAVSANGSNWFSLGLNPAFQAALDLAGDEIHTTGNSSAYRRSYDLTAAETALGVNAFRYIRLSTTGAPDNNSFDLDAIGIANFTTVAVGAVPEPATWATMIGGFGAVGGAMRRRRRQTLSTGTLTA